MVQVNNSTEGTCCCLLACLYHLQVLNNMRDYSQFTDTSSFFGWFSLMEMKQATGEGNVWVTLPKNRQQSDTQAGKPKLILLAIVSFVEKGTKQMQLPQNPEQCETWNWWTAYWLCQLVYTFSEHVHENITSGVCFLQAHCQILIAECKTHHVNNLLLRICIPLSTITYSWNPVSGWQ